MNACALPSPLPPHNSHATNRGEYLGGLSHADGVLILFLLKLCRRNQFLAFLTFCRDHLPLVTPALASLTVSDVKPGPERP